jgi:hypothetical protein
MKKGKKKIWTTMKRVKCVHLFAHEAIVSCYLSSSNCFQLFLWKKKEQKCFCFHWWKIYSFCFWSLSWKRKDKVLHRIIVIRIYFVSKTALYHLLLIKGNSKLFLGLHYAYVAYLNKLKFFLRITWLPIDWLPHNFFVSIHPPK